jgi:hypothetical protein
VRDLRKFLGLFFIAGIGAVVTACINNNSDIRYSCETNKINSIDDAKELFLSKLIKYTATEKKLFAVNEAASLKNKMIGWSIYINLNRDNGKHLWSVSNVIINNNNVRKEEMLQFTPCGIVLEEFDPDFGERKL